MDLGWYGDADITAAVAFLRHRPDLDPARIALLGLSMGGEEAVGSADSIAGLRAVVAEGVTGRVAADKAGWLPGGVAGTVQRGIDWLTYNVADLLTAAPRPAPLRTAIGESSGTRFLLITAGRVPDEAAAAAYLRAAAPGRVTVWTVPGAAHTHALAVEPQEWEARVTAFLDSALARG